MAHKSVTSSAERQALLHQAFDDSGIWRSRQALALAAPHDIISLAITATSALEAIAEVLTIDPAMNSAAYVDAKYRLWEANAQLRESMRQDLGVPGPPDPELMALKQRPQSD